MFIFIGVLVTLCKYREDWINIAKCFGVHDYAEDIVQDMYLKLHDRLNPSMNWKSYVILTIRSLCMDYHKRNNKTVQLQTFSLADNKCTDGQLLLDELQAEIDKLSLSEQSLFETLHIDKISMCKLSKETGINKTRIFRMNRDIKQKLWKRIS